MWDGERRGFGAAATWSHNGMVIEKVLGVSSSHPTLNPYLGKWVLPPQVASVNCCCGSHMPNPLKLTWAYPGELLSLPRKDTTPQRALCRASQLGQPGFGTANLHCGELAGRNLSFSPPKPVKPHGAALQVSS